MAELSLNLPVVGEKDTTAEPKVTTALTEIQTQFNGKIAAVNLETNAVETAKIKAEAVTGPKLGAETVRILTATKYESKTFTGPEMEAGQTLSATRPVFTTWNTSIVLTIGGVTLKVAVRSAIIPPGQVVKATEGWEPQLLVL